MNLDYNQSGTAGETWWGINDYWVYSGTPGKGGGLYNETSAVLLNSRVSHNQTKQVILDDGGYSAGDGGGIYNSSHADLYLKEYILSGNLATGLGGGIFNNGSIQADEGNISQNSGMKGAGGVFNSGTLKIDRSFISANSTGPGYDGWQLVSHRSPGAAPAVDGESPHGGGIFNTGIARLADIQISENQTGDGGKGCPCTTMMLPPSDGGDGGGGGGIYNSGDMELIQSLIKQL